MADKVPFELVTPTHLLVSQDVDMVVVPGGDGDFGVLPGHSPLLSTVRPGTVDLHDGGKVIARFFVAGGFAEVTPERCTVLAEEAAPVAELTRADADKRLAEAQKLGEAARTEGEKQDAAAALAAAEAMLVAVQAQA